METGNPSPTPISRLQTILQRTAIPSWMLSVVFHAMLVIVLGLMMQFAPRGAQVEAARTGGIVLKKLDESGRDYYQDGEEGQDSDSPTDSNSESTSEANSQALAAEMQADFSGDLPSSNLPIIGPGGGNSTTGGVSGMLQGSGPNRGKGVGGGGTTSVFGVTGTGSSFIYVFDRSGSMGGSGRNALRAAQEELIKSLQSIESTHQFQIIFYNQKPWIFNPGGKGRLALADDRAKENARKFVYGITADGHTDHMAALKMALSLSPDVIFFLTDADLPQLSPGELRDIKRRNGEKTSINAIEFGRGPALEGFNFIRQLAADNNGNYGYVDVLQLGAR